MSRIAIPQFPNSALDPFYLTSPDTTYYNCIAWAYGDNTRWFWPDSGNIYYWPDEIPRSVDLSSFICLFESIGYKVCDSVEFENRYEKVVIYADSNRIPTHAARQLDNGYWTSKLGPSFDISHSLESMSDGFYGNVVAVMKRERI
jgi:hypothetical protein